MTNNVQQKLSFTLSSFLFFNTLHFMFQPQWFLSFLWRLDFQMEVYHSNKVRFDWYFTSDNWCGHWLNKILFPEHQQSYISRNKAFLCTQSLNYLCTQNIIECALALASIFATSYTQLWALMCNPQFCHTWALIVSNKLANYKMSWKKFWIVSVVNLTGPHTQTYILYSRILSRKVFALQSKGKKIKKKGARIAGVRWETSMQLVFH